MFSLLSTNIEHVEQVENDEIRDFERCIAVSIEVNSIFGLFTRFCHKFLVIAKKKTFYTLSNIKVNHFGKLYNTLLPRFRNPTPEFIS